MWRIDKLKKIIICFVLIVIAVVCIGIKYISFCNEVVSRGVYKEINFEVIKDEVIDGD